MRCRVGWLAALAAVVISGIGASGAGAIGWDGTGSEPARVANLRVIGEEWPWQAEDVFRLAWEQYPVNPSFEIVAAEYQLYDRAGQPLGPVVSDRSELTSINFLQVPAPGVYTVEVWLRDSQGRTGPRSSATLRCDDAAPAAPLPRAPPGWIAGDQPAVLTIGAPPAQPISGIRGYALSTDDGGGSDPCAGIDHCTIAETDLPAGAADETVSLGPFPEGETVARVVAVSESGVASPVAEATIHVDATRPVLRLSGVPDGWANVPVRLRATAADALSGMAATGAAGAFTAIAVDGGSPSVAAGDTVTAVVSGRGTHRVAFYARDAAGNVADGRAGAPGPETAVVRIDEDPPAVLFAEGQDPSEPERIEATVEDDLSGPSATRGSIGLRPVGSRGPFQELPTKIVEGRLIATWSSDAFPSGKYEFRASGYDAAGNAATGANRARGGRMVLVNPLKTPVSIESGFGGRQMVWQQCRRETTGKRCHRHRVGSFDGRPSTRTLPYGHGVRFGGRVRALSGAPLPGLEVAVTEIFADGSRAGRRTTYARTGGDGSFSVWLGPGPSREVVASFGGDRVLTRATGRTVHLDVLGAACLRASQPVAKIGGPPIVFSGKIGRLGSTFPMQGRPVDLQFRYPGADWSEFRTVQTDSKGRFRYPYAFSDDDSSGIRFQFRALVAAEEGWPYEPAYSRPVSIIGR